MFKWHYFDQVYSRFTRDGKMVFFKSQTRPLRRETSQRRQPEVFLAVISLPLAVTDVCRRRILSRLLTEIYRQPTYIENVNQLPTKWLNFNRQPRGGPPPSHTFLKTCQQRTEVSDRSPRPGLTIKMTNARQMPRGGMDTLGIDWAINLKCHKK